MEREVRADVQRFLGMMAADQGDALALLSRLTEATAEDLIVRALDSVSATERTDLILKLGISRCRVAARPIGSCLLRDTSEHVRSMSAYSLMLIRDPGSLNELVKALTDTSENVVSASCVAISAIGLSYVERPLLDLLEAGSWRARLYASVALMGLKVRDQRILDTLERISGMPDAAEHDMLVAFIDDLESSVPCADVGNQDTAMRRVADILRDARELVE